VHTLTKDKSDDTKDKTYEELEYVLNQFPNYHKKILFGDFNVKVGTEETIGNETLHEISNDNWVRIVNLCHVKKSNCQEYNVFIL
jgi:hypothetical protein